MNRPCISLAMPMPSPSNQSGIRQWLLKTFNLGGVGRSVPSSTAASNAVFGMDQREKAVVWLPSCPLRAEAAQTKLLSLIVWFVESSYIIVMLRGLTQRGLIVRPCRQNSCELRR